MIINLIFIAAAVAGVSLLWRVYRYDPDNSFNTRLDALPYLLRKPITCGLCVTFWIAFLATILFSPLSTLIALLPYRIVLSEEGKTILGFVFEWMVLGTLSATIVYVIDTFYQVSHYYKHAAHN